MKKLVLMLSLVGLFITLTSEDGCAPAPEPVSSSGVSKANVKIVTDLNGNTIEQNNVMKRLKRDNQAGSIKHLYILSAYSGQVMIYSTVKGKVTSSGKRLSPCTIEGGSGYKAHTISGDQSNDNRVTIGDNNYITNEVLGDDGTYGSSVEYIFWFDSKDVYHQQYITGGMILHISDQPLAVKSVVLNMETNETK